MSPLGTAARDGQLEIAQALVNSNACFDASAVVYSIASDKCKKLVSADVKLNEIRNPDG